MDYYDRLRKLHEGSEMRALPLNIEEVQEWLDAGLTGEELRAKLQGKILEREELERLADLAPENEE
jgi:hypothetical protein